MVVQFTVGPIGKKWKGESPMSIILTDEQQCGLAVAFKTAAGNPATVDGVPSWTVADPAVLEIEAKPDGLSAIIVSKGLGVCQVSVTADADLGSGVTSITGVLDVEVKPAEAVSVGISAGEPESIKEINPLK
jgi:hypothetical protein